VRRSNSGEERAYRASV